MTQRTSGAQAAATRPLSALISAALLLLTMVAGVGGVGGFAGLGPNSAGPITRAAPATSAPATAAAASVIGVPVVGERRAAPVLGTPSSKKHTAGWAPQHHPESADVPTATWQPPVGVVEAVVPAPPAVLALTIQVAHRGRAPPTGSLQT